MPLFLSGMLVLNGVIGLMTYLLMRKKSPLLSERYGMTMATCSSSVLSLNIGLIVHFLFPVSLASIVFYTTVIGGFIGIGFGSLVTFQSLLSGVYHGVVGAIMGTMLSAVIQNPALCSLPGEYLYLIGKNTVLFTLFGTILVIVTCGLLVYSFWSGHRRGGELYWHSDDQDIR